MRYIVRGSWALTLLLLMGCPQEKQNEEQAERPSDKRPNIVFILADDLGWADLPSYGNRFNEAPNLEKLAQEGRRYTNAYAASAVCSPTRASIMSGQYPARVGITDFIPGHWRPYEKVTVPVNRTQYLPTDIVTMAEVLKGAGYTTGYFGKWHLGKSKEHHPLRQGFDKANTGQGYYGSNFEPPRDQAAEKRFSERITDFGIDFMEENKGAENPFFLFVSHYDVHVPLEADMDLITKFQEKEKVEDYPSNAIYAAMVEHLDRSVGRINDWLKENGLSENTILVFFSDNGGLERRFDLKNVLANSQAEIYEDSELSFIASSNDPLRGEKGTLYEGGIREPMIVKWPKEIKANTISDALVTSVDFLPTFADLANTELPDKQIFDGKNIRATFASGENSEGLAESRTIFWHYPIYHHDIPKSAVRKGHWKLIHNLQDDEYELYNLKDDIGETTNLAEDNVGKKEELQALLAEWITDTGASMPVVNPNFDMTKREEWGKHPDRK